MNLPQVHWPTLVVLIVVVFVILGLHHLISHHR